MTIYLRQLDGADETELLSEDRWLDYAKDWVTDVDLAREVGFRSAGARYWTEPANFHNLSSDDTDYCACTCCTAKRVALRVGR